MNKPTLLATAFSMLVLGGCTTLPYQGQENLVRGAVGGVSTDYSLGLACVGGKIERTRKPVLTVFIDDIEDLTVPSGHEDRRLSSGGKWWIHTAINKLGSKRVQAVVARGGRANDRNPNHLVMTGAWTQDDHEVGQRSGGIEALFPKIGIALGGRDRFDVIAGDFVSSRGGKVVHASAISVALSSTRAGLNLIVEDGNRQFKLDFSQSMHEGPQFAQRRIAAAAVVVHIARAFGVDYRSCIETKSGEPLH